MTLLEFKASLTGVNPPSFNNPLLEALWHEGKDNWQKAHTLAQDIHTPEGCWVHAYLHRKEGDDGNASYWYHRANRKMPRQTVVEEWEDIVSVFLSGIE